MNVLNDSSLTVRVARSRTHAGLYAFLAVAVALLAFALAACGGGDSGDDGGSSPETVAEPDPAKQPVPTSTALSATITGRVTFGAEAKRKPAFFNMEADPVCAGKNAEDPKTEQAFLLSESKGIANVLIQVKSGLPDLEFAAAESEVVFTQSGCIYDPHILIARVGQTVKVLNPDGTLHNVHVFGKVNEEFNQAMPKFQTEIERAFDKVETDPFAIKCDVHPWMNAFGVVLDHPYAAVTAADGSFSIPNLPAGTYQVEVWHELLGSQTHEVTVAEGATETLDATLLPPGWEPATCPNWNTPGYFKSATSQDVQRCIDAGSDPNARNSIGFTPLHFASENDNLAAIDVLISARADANARSDGGQTPLHSAAIDSQDPKVVERLVDAGADPNRSNNDGGTPLHAAVAFERDVAIVAALLEAGANQNAKANNGTTPLSVAVALSADAAVIDALRNAAAN